mmetsp:Transcript_25987/g.29185  ORF Transcript_25987/g.29185 Transcript_25987/m.29185 type:complete len:505 (+) Transcript_25987:35-1549(+)
MSAPLLSSSLSAASENNNTGEVRHRTRASTRISSNNHFENDLEHQNQYRYQFQSQQARILDRSGASNQSRGRWGVERRDPRGDDRTRDICCCRKIYQDFGKDWFFWLAYKKTFVLFLLLFFSYSLIIGFFGFIYLALSIFGSKAEINPDGSTKTIAFCDMDINDHMEAMYFSLSTMTTIGYGVSDYYFGGCYSPLLIVLWQICTAIVFDAVAVGLIFHRISRGASRSRSILFSDKAIVRYIQGSPHFMFRLGERRKYHLIEATVRCYCIRHERIPRNSTADIEAHLPSMMDDHNNDDTKYQTSNNNNNNPRVHVETTHFVSRQMRLLQPDDRFGSHVWMGLPQVVVHRMDESSPLRPTPLWFDVQGIPRQYPPIRTSEISDSVTTPVDSDLLSSNNIPNNEEIDSECIRNFLYDRDIEVVVLVEGTDEGTGAVTQARHSYKLCDIAFNHKYHDCVHPYNCRQRNGPSSLDPVVSIDFAKFHDIIPLSADEIDCESCAYVHGHEK